ncbi:hypothetical protein Micbo1qcDRAFT_197177 [Microdochium bolleyi]|uniref:Mid2 domain-containing protein n=1 Tax=Microdochium bolleyi TaxID=196109 RepID=A0A136IVD0_9PEZI|nr:hypothetical protein Micbo1qcDRAFT_197177 [Microdochium bolleyi]
MKIFYHLGRFSHPLCHLLHQPLFSSLREATMLVHLFYSACFLFPIATAQSGNPVDWNNRFMWPPLPGQKASLDATAFYGNPVIEYGKPLSRPFTFITRMNATAIMMQQEHSPELAKRHLIRDCVPNRPDNATTMHYWDGNIGEIDVELTNVVFLIAYECDFRRAMFGSHYFNLTRAVSASTTSSRASTPTSIAAPADPTPGAGNTTSGSNTVVLAGAIGGGIGGALLLIAAAFACWRYTKNKKDKSQHHLLLQQQQQQPPPYGFLPDDSSGVWGTRAELMTTLTVCDSYEDTNHQTQHLWKDHGTRHDVDDAAAYPFHSDYVRAPPNVAVVPPAELSGDSHFHPSIVQGRPS